MLPELKRTGGQYGVVSMCIGTGMGAAAVFKLEQWFLPKILFMWFSKKQLSKLKYFKIIFHHDLAILFFYHQSKVLVFTT